MGHLPGQNSVDSSGVGVVQGDMHAGISQSQPKGQPDVATSAEHRHIALPKSPHLRQASRCRWAEGNRGLRPGETTNTMESTNHGGHDLVPSPGWCAPDERTAIWEPAWHLPWHGPPLHLVQVRNYRPEELSHLAPASLRPV